MPHPAKQQALWGCAFKVASAASYRWKTLSCSKETRAVPSSAKEVMLMQFYSEKGRQGKPSFATQRVYFSVDTW